jgi:hypothetical protein
MYKIEFVPRYGTTLGIISKEEEGREEDTIGHVRLSDEDEEERWKRVIELLNQEWKKEMKKHPPQRLEQDIY